MVHPFSAPRRRRAVVAAVLLGSAVTTALAGCSGAGDAGEAGSPAPSSATPSSHATPTDSTISSPAPSATTANGFDREAVYAACDAAVPADVWGGKAPLAPAAIVADSFGPAASNAYAADHTNGDPNALYVNVQYFRGDAFAFSALCVASGDPAAPRVEYIRTLD